jgi:hypothetical protein
MTYALTPPESVPYPVDLHLGGGEDVVTNQD